MSNSAEDRPSGIIRLVTPAASDLPDGPCRSINCSADMTATVVDLTGTTITSLQLHKGYNPVKLMRIVSVSTGTVWALY